jgi:transposase
VQAVASTGVVTLDDEEPEMSLALPDAMFVAGIDWAAAEHAVCVLDESGKIMASFTICHDADGLQRLIRRLAAFGEPGSIPVGIERPFSGQHSGIPVPGICLF